MRGGARQGLRGRAGGSGWSIAIGDGNAVGGSAAAALDGGLCDGGGLGDDVDALQHGRRILRQVRQGHGVEGGRDAAGAGHLYFPLDVARVGAGNAAAGGVGHGLAPIAPGAVRLGGVAGARAESNCAGGGHIGAPTDAAPARGGAGIVHRRFVGTGGAGDFTEAVQAAHVAGGGKHGVIAREQARGLAFIGLGDQRHAAIGREAVDPAILVGGEENLLLERQQIVDVFFLGTPQGLDGVIRVDAVDGALLDAADIHHRSELRADLGGGGGRGAGLGLLRLGGVGRFDFGRLGFHGDGGDR